MPTTILAKNVGTISKTQLEIPFLPLPRPHAVMFMYSLNYFSGYQHGVGAGLPEIHNDSTTKRPSLIVTGCRYPKYKMYTANAIFVYVTEILARMVAAEINIIR